MPHLPSVSTTRQIVKGGAASKTSLRIGDRILCVNGKDLKDATHQDAVMALVSPTYELNLRVRHDPPPPGLQVGYSPGG